MLRFSSRFDPIGSREKLLINTVRDSATGESVDTLFSGGLLSAHLQNVFARKFCGIFNARYAFLEAKGVFSEMCLRVAGTPHHSTVLVLADNFLVSRRAIRNEMVVVVVDKFRVIANRLVFHIFSI